MFEGLRKNIALRKLQKEFKNTKRIGKVKNLDEALSVGILYHVDRAETYHLVKKYVKHLKEQEGIRRIMAIGFVDAKELSADYNSKLEFDFFCRKDLNRLFRPQGNTIRNFIDEDYDIVLELTNETILPLRYMLISSRAKFKVGYYSEANEPYFDMMIDTGKSYNMVDFIDQINHYLKMINKKK